MRSTRLSLPIVLLALSLSPAVAEDSDDCVEIAAGFERHFFGFPEIEQDTAERLVSWRASCAGQPPGGKGNVFALCQAQLPVGGAVFYWRKTGVNAETSGYEICDY